jgi:hypothetical protein
VALLLLVVLLSLISVALIALVVCTRFTLSIGVPIRNISTAADLSLVESAASRFRPAASDQRPPSGMERPRWSFCTRLSPA